MIDFSTLRLPEVIRQAITNLGITKPTPIQQQAIPLALEGKDLIACAETGSGKTLAFVLPMTVKVLSQPQAMGLILAPTRELAAQIAAVIKTLCQNMPQIHTTLIIGGENMMKQVQSLKKQPRFIVATPGRLSDHLRQQPKLLQNVKVLTLDEGDRMLDMGFMPQLDFILRFLPPKRQTLLLSATMPKPVRLLAKKYLTNPAEVKVGSDPMPTQKIKQFGLQTSNEKKNDMLMDELNARKGSIIVFAKTQVRTDRVSKFLESYGFAVAKIHGGRSQGQRNSAIQGFRDGRFRILIATDIAARGIDVPQIAHVINYDLPMCDDDYVHRIGRTARAGASGEAVSLITPNDRDQWTRLSRKYMRPNR